MAHFPSKGGFPLRLTTDSRSSLRRPLGRVPELSPRTSACGPRLNHYNDLDNRTLESGIAVSGFLPAC